LQNIDYSNIVCNKCNKNNRSITYNNEFYYCDICKMNICPICKSTHDNNHIIINYNDKEFKCNIHNENFISYCNECKRNICMSCEEEHNEHSIIYYGKLIIKDNKIINRMKEIKEEIDKFNNDIKEKINKLNIIIKNMEEYYNIIDNIIKKVNNNNKKRNYQLLITINNIINKNNMINNIKRINENNNKYDDIIDIYNKIYNNKINNKNNVDNIIINEKNNDKNNNERNKESNNEKKNDDNIIIYKINEKEDKIKIFGWDFVNNNKNKIKLEIEGKECELMEYYNINNNKIKNIHIKIKGIEKVTNMSYMFSRCSSLSNLPDISKWDTNNVTSIKYNV